MITMVVVVRWDFDDGGCVLMTVVMLGINGDGVGIRDKGGNDDCSHGGCGGNMMVV